MFSLLGNEWTLCVDPPRLCPCLFPYALSVQSFYIAAINLGLENNYMPNPVSLPRQSRNMGVVMGPLSHTHQQWAFPLPHDLTRFGISYGLNVCVPPNITVLGGEAFGRWLGYKGGALVNGISALIRKKKPGSSLALSTTWGHKEEPAAWNRKRAPIRALLCQCPGLQPPAFSPVKKTCAECKPPGLWYSAMAAQVDEDSFTF